MFRFVSIFVVCCTYAVLTLHLAKALTDEQGEEITKVFDKMAVECIKDNMISEKDVGNLKSDRDLEPGLDSNIGCFLACFMKKMGIMDEEGMVPTTSPDKLVKVVANDPDELKELQEYFDTCLPVNSKAVTDGEKGCERAIFAFNCMKNNETKFMIDV